MTENSLDTKSCSVCLSGDGVLTPADAQAMLKQLNSDWALDAEGAALERKFTFKGFAKAVYYANLCAWLADREGHHPDVRFGWGYTTVLLTSHEAGGLTENDFIWARKFDKLLDV